MYLDLLCLILFPLCLLPHPNTFFPPTKLLFIPQYPFSVSLLLWDHTLWSLLCNGAWQAATQCLISLPRPGSAHSQQHPCLPGQGSSRSGPYMPAHPYPWVNLQSPGGKSYDTYETVGIFSAANSHRLSCARPG